MSPGPPRESLVLMDAHVHFQDGFRFGPFLDAAADNLRRAVAESDGTGEGAVGVLVLTEVRGKNVFGAWAELVENATSWSFRPTDEPHSLWAERGSERLAIVRGRQVRAVNGLEVLMLGSTTVPDDGLPFGEALDGALSGAELAVVPWGFGKWWWRRGRLLGRTLAALEGSPLLRRVSLGDNGCRPFDRPRPPLLEAWASAGRTVLSGSDPLPLPGHETRAGSFGTAFGCFLDPAKPFASLARHIVEGGPGRGFGARRAPLDFVRDQIRLRRA